MATGDRFVRTPEGAERFGVPIGAKIVVDEQGRVIRPRRRARIQARRRDVRDGRRPTKFVATVPGQKAKIPLDVLVRRATRKSARKAARQTPRRSQSGLGRSVRSTLGHVRRLDELVELGNKQRALLERVHGGARINERQRNTLEQILKEAIRKLRKKLGMSGESDEGEDGKEKKSKEPKPSKKKAGKSSTDESRVTSPEDFLEDLQQALKALQNMSKRGGRRGRSTGDYAPTSQDYRVKRQNYANMNDKELTHAIRSLVQKRRLAEDGGSPTAQIERELKRAREVREQRHARRQRREQLSRRRKRAREAA